jgi:hypothetical protein
MLGKAGRAVICTWLEAIWESDLIHQTRCQLEVTDKRSIPWRLISKYNPMHEHILNTICMQYFLVYEDSNLFTPSAAIASATNLILSLRALRIVRILRFAGIAGLVNRSVLRMTAHGIMCERNLLGIARIRHWQIPSHRIVAMPAPA